MCMPPAGYGSRSHVTEARPRVRERPVNYRVNYRDNHRAKYRVNAVASWFLFASPRARAASTRGDASASVQARLGAIVAAQGGYVQSGMLAGVGIGVSLAVCVLAAACHLRWRAKRLQARNSKYTPYGQADDDFSSGEPRLASAVDDDDDDDEHGVHRDPVIDSPTRDTRPM